MATVGKETHRMPMETTAEYSRFTSMGKKGIEEKERTGKKQRKGKEREGKERKGKERKGKEHHRRKGQKKGRGYNKKEQVPPQGTNTWLQWGRNA